MRDDIVNPALFQPFADIGVEVVVVGLTRAGGGTFGVFALVAPHAERADAEFHVGFRLFDGIAEHLDEGIHIVAAPVVNMGESLSVAQEVG